MKFFKSVGSLSSFLLWLVIGWLALLIVGLVCELTNFYLLHVSSFFLAGLLATMTVIFVPIFLKACFSLLTAGIKGDSFE